VASSTELLRAGWDALIEAAFRTGDFTLGRQLLESARTRAVQDGDVAAEAAAIDGLGMLAHYSNVCKLMSGETVAEADADAEEALFHSALRLHREVDDLAGSAQSLLGVGLVLQVLRHDWGSAVLSFGQALAIVEECATVDLYTRSEIHRHMGFYYLVEAQEPDVAVRHLQESLNLREELADPCRIPSGLIALAQAYLAAGDRHRAIELLKRAVAEAHNAGLMQERINDAENVLREAQAGLG
jgi:tetratricopeptide (TPR) repeat protein